MTIAQRVEAFFRTIEEIWAAVPGYVKVFLYSTTAAIIGLHVAGQLNFEAVFLVVAANLGLYQLPRTVGTQTRKLL